MNGWPTLCFVVGMCSRIVISYPYGDYYRHDEYEADHAAAVAEVDAHSLDIPFLDETAKDYEKETGGIHDDLFYSNAGQKGDRGYSGYEDFEKARSGQYGTQGQKGRYKEEGGHKNGYGDSSNYYNDKHAASHGSKGGNFAVSNSFNKGSVTKGFHNVHHKEEYKKNHKFYDDANKSGYYQRYGDFGASLLAASGGANKGNHYNQGYNRGDYGKEGFAKKGSLYSNAKQYAGANGYNSNFNNQQNFGNRGGRNQGKEYAYHH